ncbi:MAG: histidine kinase N-terminal 7TM domain-containing protein [Chloroflexota bacterium]
MFELTTITLILCITTAFNLIASFISWQRRKTQMGFYFALGMFGVTFWTLAAGFDYAAIPIPLKIFFAKLEYAGYNFAFVFFAFFALCYAGYEHWLKDIRLKVFFMIVLVSNILLAWTNDWTGWLWVSFTRSAIGENTVIFEHGPGELWAAVTGYMMILIIIVPLWQASRHGPDFSRRQARLIFYATLLPVVGNLLYLFQPPQFKGVDWSSLLFSISSILCLLALYGTRFLDLAPIARDKLVAGLSDGMIVLDIQNRIIDVNQVAAKILQTPLEKLFGQTLLDVTPLARSFLEQPPEQDFKTELEIGSTGKRYFDLLISPLRERQDQIIGRLIILRDITTRKENELRLLQLTQAVEQSPASVVITNLRGNIDYVNPRFAALTGYSQSEVVGKNPNIIQSGHTPVETYHEMWRTIQSGQVWRGELLNKKKNGELYWEHEVVAPVFDAAGNIINYIAVKEDITERKQAEAALEQRFLEIQELHKNLQETQAQLMTQQRALATLDERQRLGRDMHDSVNQSIHSLMLFSETLIALLQKDQTEKAIHVAERIQESGRQALKEIRLLVYETQSLLVDEQADLLNSLEERLNMVERRVGIKAEIVCEAGSMEYCPPEWNENLYWMIVEALNNSLKHAQARSVKVSIHCTEKQLEVEVKDDGAGFDTSRVRSGGFGMRTMRERAEILGGELSVQSSPGYGTSVNFSTEIGA